jgi:glycosyltransferase involved in cell wall biosynthesis
MRIAAIIPAYNEEKAIAAVISDINNIAKEKQLHIDAIVVNDCSKDTTSEVISKLNCIALNLPINLGIGGAVQTGFKYAFENNYDYAIQVDGDGQHPASEIPVILKKAMEENADVVIGSRFISKNGFQSSAIRRFGINYFKWLNRILVGVIVNDSTSGFRMINKKVLALVSEYYPDEYPEPEAVILYSLNHFKIVEIQVTMKERQGGVSSIGALSSIYYMFKVTLAIVYTFIRIKFKKK